MMPRRPRRLRRRFPGFLAAVLVLLGQIAIGIAPCCEGARLEPVAFGKAIPICHAGPSESGSPTRRDDHRGPDCALCPLCLAHATAAAFLTPVPAPLARPVLVARRTTVLPPARAPPPLAVLAAIYPTGPPTLA